MTTLNQLYNKSCKPKYEKYKKLSNNIVLIDNFFENFDLARNFFKSRDKWDCIPYQNNSKPGYESVFPSWIGKSLMEKYIFDNKIIDDINSYSIVCNFFYDNLNSLWSISNSSNYPHIDSVQNYDMLQYICLINLNLISVSTKFYQYKNKFFCSKNMKKEWDGYTKNLQKELLEYYNNQKITDNDLILFFQKKELDIKLNNIINYNPNQAIIYPANLFHSPNLNSKFTKDNPRIMLRICFDKKIESKFY